MATQQELKEQEVDLAAQVQDAYDRGEPGTAKNLMQQLLAVQEQIISTPIPDSTLYRRGVDRELLEKERALAAEIATAKDAGDTDKVSELTQKLIAVQKKQPIVGARFQ